MSTYDDMRKKYEKMSRERLIHQLVLMERMEEMHEDLVRLVCKPATVQEAELWGNYVRYNTEYFLWPEPKEEQYNA